MEDFINYVYSFYGANDRLYDLTYDGKLVTKEDIFAAFKVYQSRLFNAYFSNNLRYLFTSCIISPLRPLSLSRTPSKGPP